MVDLGTAGHHGQVMCPYLLEALPDGPPALAILITSSGGGIDVAPATSRCTSRISEAVGCEKLLIAGMRP